MRMRNVHCRGQNGEGATLDLPDLKTMIIKWSHLLLVGHWLLVTKGTFSLICKSSEETMTQVLLMERQSGDSILIKII